MLTRSTLSHLVGRQGPWVTICAPLNGGGALARKDPVRYRNLVRSVRDQLAERVRDSGQRHRILEALERVADDRRVFSAGAEGMVVFANPEGAEHWHLPTDVPELAVVDDRPHLESLIPIVSDPTYFYLVSLTLHGTKLFSCDRYGARELPLPAGTPKRLEDAAGWEIEEDHLQFHSMRSAPKTTRNEMGNSPVFHGHGGGKDDRESDYERYLRAIDQALLDRVVHRDAPIVLACSEKVEGIFRRISQLPSLVEPALHGNYENAPLEELHAKALDLMKPHFEATITADCARYCHARGTGLTVERIEDVVPAAADGRIEILFLREGAHIEGTYDPETQRVYVGKRNGNGKSNGNGSSGQTTDLVDRVASDTFLTGGTVHLLPEDRMPVDGDVAALLRY